MRARFPLLHTALLTACTAHAATRTAPAGQYLVLMDWLHGTLVTPEAFDAQQKAGGKAAKAE